MIVIASAGVIPTLLDITTDTAFHTTPLATAVGYEELVL